MISKDNYQLVKKAIKIHNNLKDRTYLILYKVNSKQKAKIMETPILEENFWHLVGCKIDDSKKLTPEQKHQVYLKCLAEENDKIVLIISKLYGHTKYDRLDYALSHKIFPSIIDELPNDITYEENLFNENMKK